MESLNFTGQVINTALEFTGQQGSTQLLAAGNVAVKGDKGDKGAKGDDGTAGAGVPEGGLAGQWYRKKTNTNYDGEFADITPADVSLGQVDNTADLDKPISTATQTALNGKLAVGSTTSGVPDSTDKRYVTDAERTKLANTSGTNTGDQDLSGLTPKTRTVNGHALTADVAVTQTDIGLPNVTNDVQLKASQLDTDTALAANSDTKVPSQKAIKTYTDSAIATGAPDATTSTKGKVQLTGDLSGTATSPIVKSRISVTVGANADYNFSDPAYSTTQAAIQAAIDAYTGTGVEVVINSSYTLTGSVIVKSNVSVRHKDDSIVCTFNSGHVAGVPTAPNSGFHAYMTSALATNFKLQNMSFNGGLTTLATGVDGAEYHAIYIKNGSHDFTVANIYGTCGASGIVRFRDTCYSFIGRNIKAYQADCAVICTVGCQKFTLDNISAISCFAEGLYLGSGINNFNLTNIYTESCGTRGLSINNDATPLTRGGIQGNVANVQALNCGLEGVYLVGCDELHLVNIYSRGNQRNGVTMSGCNNITIASSQAWNNNQVRASDGVSTYVGFMAYDSKRIGLVQCIANDDGATTYQYRGIDSQQSGAGNTDYIKVVGGRVENTVSSSQAVIIGNNSTATNLSGYNPDRYVDNGNVSASPQVLLKNGNMQRLIITQNTTLQTLDTNAVPGQTLTILVVQNGTGGYTFTLPANAHTLKTFVANTAANAMTAITFRFVSSASGWVEVGRTPQGDANGAFTPADVGLLATNFDPAVATTSSTALPTNGTVYVMKLRADSVLTVSNIIMAITTAGATLTSGQNFAALYDSGKNLLAQTSDQSTAWASTGVVTMALSSSQTILPGYFYVAVWSNATTRPAFARGNSAPVTNGLLSGATSRFASANTSITTTAPSTIGTMTAISTAFWAGIS